MATSSLRRRSGRADALARWLLAALLAGALLLFAAWAWRQPFMARPRALWELSRMPPPTSLPVPVQGVAPRQIAATFGAPRGSDRRHEGLDIFAARGTPVRSATRGIVIAIRDRGLGGRQVWVLGPAGERHYYAHLDDWAPALAEGEVIEAGTPLGTVGNTGNARTTPPHLHYGIYGGDGALDPLPRIRAVR
jgi:murein DD-endopeptidase MepM/ murein hydrolase activator NlpD